MKAIVHIGAPKTGSSSIQDFLFVNREALAERGIAYERNLDSRGSQWEYPIAAHWRLGVLPYNLESRLRYSGSSMEEMERECAPALERLASMPERRDEPLAIFSTEHGLPFLRGEDLIRSFDRMFSEVFEDVRYVLYLRDPRRLIPSSYSERMRRGLDMPFDAYLLNRLSTYSPAKQVEQWANVVGRERFEIRLMDPGTMKDGDLLEDFCDLMGTTMAGLVRPPRANESLTAVGILVMQSLNKFIPEIFDDGSRNPLRIGLLARVDQMTADDPPLILSPAERARIEAVTGADMEAIRAGWFPGRNTLFPEPKATEPTPSAQLEARAREVLAEIVYDLRRAELDRTPVVNRTDQPKQHVEDTPMTDLVHYAKVQAARGLSAGREMILGKDKQETAGH